VNSIYARPGQMGTVLVAAYASDANAAAANANAVASSVIDVYQADQASRKDDSRQYLESQLAQLHPGTGAYLDTYERLQSEYVALSSSLDSIYVLAPAVPPSTPVRPDRSRYLLVALLTGICAGLLAALVRERVDDRVRTAEDVARAAATRLVVSIDGRAPAERRARLLSIAARKLGARGKTLLVVAARKEERAGEVAEALVRAATVNGDPAVLYRANLGTRSPALAARAIQAGSWGLTLVAVPAPAESPMAVSLARLADGAVIVASAGKTRFSQVAGAAAALRAAGVPTVAAVVTPAAPLPRLLEVGR
jgi:hypothetical protein